MLDFLFYFSIGLLFIATLLYVFSLYSPNKLFEKLAVTILFIAFFSLAGKIVFRYIQTGNTPVVSLFESLTFFAWAILGAYLLVTLKYRINILGVIVAPVSLILLITASTLTKDILQVSPVLKSFWFPVHVAFGFFGHSAFAIAAFAGILYLIQEKNVKKKKKNSFLNVLPPLASLDEANYLAISIGFPLFTLSIITGAVWAEYAWGTYWSWDPKQTWSLIAWFFYALILHLRLTSGWRGKKASLLSIAGFGVVIFCYLGVNILLKGLHTFR